MNTQLLIKMLELASANRSRKHVSSLALQIAVDPELGDEVTMEDFPNDRYDVRSIKWICQCISFQVY